MTPFLKGFASEMEKLAFAGKVEFGIKGALLGAGIGELAGILAGHATLPGKFNWTRPPSKKQREHLQKYQFRAALGGAILGAISGVKVGHDFDRAMDEFYRSWGRQDWDPFSPGTKTWPDWLPKSVKTRSQAKKIYHSQVLENHPDRIQDAAEKKIREEKLKGINTDWDAVQNHPDFPKTAMPAFLYDILWDSLTP